MRLLATAHWSFGRDKDLLRLFEDLLKGWDLAIHALESDPDLNRAMSCFSGRPDLVFERLERLADAAFERIDLNRQIGAHPRIGALDVCTFVRLANDSYPLQEEVQAFCDRLASQHHLPVLLSKNKPPSAHDDVLDALKAGGFGGLLLLPEIPSDFGPRQVHPRLGAALVQEREFELAFALHFQSEDLRFVRELANQIKEFGEAGRPLFSGVSAMGLPLASRQKVLLLVTLSEPDYTSPDAVIEFIQEHARRKGVPFASARLLGAIRPGDLPGATRLPIRDEQIVR